MFIHFNRSIYTEWFTTIFRFRSVMLVKRENGKNNELLLPSMYIYIMYKFYDIIMVIRSRRGIVFYHNKHNNILYYILFSY